MTRQAAKAFYDVQAGDPATGYITPADAQAALDVVYDDMAASSVARITGSPEGVRVGNPGDSVIQTDASARDVKGWLRWVKATGTGNTGWVAGPEADTGWRNVTASLINGWSGTNALYIRRVGNRVQLQGGYPGITGAAKTSNLFYVPPSGFATTTRAGNYGSLGQSVNHSGGDALGAVTRDAGTGLQLIGATAAWVSVTVTASWITADPWPSTLPGVLA